MPQKRRASKRPTTKAHKKKSFFWWFVKWGCIGAFWAIAGVAVVISWYAKNLPEIEGFDLANKRPSIVFLTKDRREIATHGHLYGETVTADKVPTQLIQALLATEDRRFFEHGH